jgi:hypothetical protein
MGQTDTLLLDPEQRAAAHSTPRRPLLVLAGPGSARPPRSSRASPTCTPLSALPPPDLGQSPP